MIIVVNPHGEILNKEMIFVSEHKNGCTHDCSTCSHAKNGQCSSQQSGCSHDCSSCSHAKNGQCPSQQQTEGCTHDCSSCSHAVNGQCPSQQAQSFAAPANPFSNVKKVIAVVSGKGGVGKSMVTASLAVQMARKGFKVGIMDADITGPSMPQMFGVHERAMANQQGIIPAVTKGGIKMMSINLLLENVEDPVVWRGPVLAGVVKQFWSDVLWEELDYLFIDMPPGTGDVPLTVFQSLPIDGIVIVTSPQDLVSMIVKKASNMAKLMNIPVVGLVENMSYIVCPDCGKKMHIFGNSKVEAVAADMGLDVLAQMPLNPELAHCSDEGTIEKADLAHLDGAVAKLEAFLNK